MEEMTPEGPPQEEIGGGTSGDGLAEKRRIVRHLADPELTERGPRGYFAPLVVRVVVFYLVALNLLAAVVVGVLGIWGYVPADLVVRAIGSFAVLTAGTLAFHAINEQVG